MYVDKELLLSDEQAICAGATTEYSENSIDLIEARNIAKGHPLYVVIVVDVIPAGGTGANITFSVVTATHKDLVVGQKVLISTPAIVKASLAAGRTPIVLALPPLPESGGAQQFLGLKYVADNLFTTGKVTAFIALDPTTNF